MADTLKSTSERPDWAAEIDDHKILGKIGWLDIDSIARLAIDMKSRAYCELHDPNSELSCNDLISTGRYSNFQVGAGFLIKSAVAEASGLVQFHSLLALRVDLWITLKGHYWKHRADTRLKM